MKQKLGNFEMERDSVQVLYLKFTIPEICFFSFYLAFPSFLVLFVVVVVNCCFCFFLLIEGPAVDRDESEDGKKCCNSKKIKLSHTRSPCSSRFFTDFSHK